MDDQIKEQITALLADFAIENIFTAIIVTVICLIVIKVLLKLFDRMAAKSRLESSVMKLIRVAVKILLLFVGVIIVMSCLGIPVTSLVAVLSVCGLAISLAVQNFMGNVAGGIQIIATKPYKVGDYVEVNGCAGTVTELGLFHTNIATSDNKIIHVPNSSIVSNNIVNYTENSRRQVEIFVRASYDTPVEQVIEVLTELVSAHPLTATEDEPAQIHVSSYGDSSITYRIRVWCGGDDYWTVYFDLMDTIKPTFDRNGIRMSYPHVNVHMMEMQATPSDTK